jgi:hypothetical protein
MHTNRLGTLAALWGGTVAMGRDHISNAPGAQSHTLPAAHSLRGSMSAPSYHMAFDEPWRSICEMRITRSL